MNPLMLVSQAVLGGSFVTWALVIVVVLAIVAIVYAVAQQMGTPIPPFVVKVFWIMFTAVIAIAAILFIARIAGFA